MRLVLGPEEMLQRDFFHWFHLQYPKRLIWANPNGGKRETIIDYRGRKICPSGMKLKITGTKKGVLDITIAEPNGNYCGMYLELKIPPNTTTKEQKQMIKDLKERRYCAEVAYNFDEAVLKVKKYFEGNHD